MNLVNLVLAGGGAKGFAYVGVARALEENGTLNNIRKFVGTNTGSIVAAMLCVGFNSYDVEALMPLTMELLHRDSWRIIRTSNSMAWHPSTKFQKYLEEVLALKTEKSSLTFAKVCQKFKKELCVTAINAGGKEEIFDSTKAADTAIPDAICQSIHIPAEFKKDKKVIYDGGFTFNYPIHCSDAGETLGCLTYSNTGDPEKKNLSTDTKLSSEAELKERILHECSNCKKYLDTFYNFFCSKMVVNKTEELTFDEFAQTFNLIPIQESEKNEKYQARLYAEMMYGLDVNASMIHKDITKVGDRSNVTKKNLDEFKQDKEKICEQMYNAVETTPKKVNESLSFEKEHLARTIDINTGCICASDFLMDDCDIKFLIEQGKHSTEEFVHKSIDAPKTTSLTAADIEGLLERTYL